MIDWMEQHLFFNSRHVKEHKASSERRRVLMTLYIYVISFSL